MTSKVVNHIWYLALHDQAGTVAIAEPVAGGRWRCVPQRFGAGALVDDESAARAWLEALGKRQVAA